MKQAKKYRSAYKLKNYQNELKKAVLTDKSKAILQQLAKDQSFVWFGIFEEKTQQIKIEILPTCEHDTPQEQRTNKFGEPFKFQNEIIPIIVGKPPLKLKKGQRTRPGIIHVEAAKILGISEDGIGNGYSCAGGGWLEGDLRFKSTSHNSWAFIPNALFVHLYADEDQTVDTIKREIPYAIADLIAVELQENSKDKFKVQMDLKNEEMEFEQLSPESLQERLQSKLSVYIREAKYGLTRNLINDCKDEKIALNLNKAMFHAIEEKKIKILNLLMESGEIDYSLVDSTHGTFLDYAIKLESDEIVNLLLKQTDKLCDHDGALLFALSKNPPNLTLASTLLNSNKVNINLAKKFGKSALDYATLLGNQELILTILKEHKIEKPILNQALLLAVQKRPEDLPTVKLLLNFSKGTHAVDGSNKSILDYAIFAGNENVLKYLLDNNFLTDQQIVISLWRVTLSQKPDAKIMEMLIEKCKKYLDQPDRNKQTLLHHAVYNKKNMIVELLLNAGVDIEKTNNKGLKAIDIARRVGNEVAEDLINNKMLDLLEIAENYANEDSDSDAEEVSKSPESNTKATPHSGKREITEKEWKQFRSFGAEESFLKANYVLISSADKPDNYSLSTSKVNLFSTKNADNSGKIEISVEQWREYLEDGMDEEMLKDMYVLASNQVGQSTSNDRGF